jgi:CheY-like chemotaxis protein
MRSAGENMGIREVMVVDDEQDMLKVMAFILSSKGYQVHTSVDGKEAIEKLTGTQPDLIFLDLEMPHASGFEVMEHLRSHSRFAKVFIVILTAHTLSAEEESRLKKIKIHGRLQKPFSVEEIHSVLNRCSDLKGN